MTTYNKLPYSNQFERGHSFNWAGQWKEGRYYYNDSYVTDFVVYNNILIVCRKNHLASKELEPKPVWINGKISDVEGPYWEFIASFIGNNPANISNIEYDESTGELKIYYLDGRYDTFDINVHVSDVAIHIGDEPPENDNKIWIDTKDRIQTQVREDPDVLGSIQQAIYLLQQQVSKLMLLRTNGIISGSVTDSTLTEIGNANDPVIPEIIEDDYNQAIEDGEIDPDVEFPEYATESEPTVNHVAIKMGTYSEIQNSKRFFINGELVWCTDKLCMYIFNNGVFYIVASSGSTPPTDDDMDKTELQTYLDNLSSISFIPLKDPDSTYTVRVNEYGNLIVYDKNNDTVQSEPASNTIYFNNQGMGSVIINSFYLGGLDTDEHSYQPCSHNYVELANISYDDINLNGIQLMYTYDNSRWFKLPLWGVIKAQSTFLVRGAQCSVMDVNTTLLKVKTFDMEWRDNGELIKFDRNNQCAVFYLCWYNVESGQIYTRDLSGGTANPMKDYPESSLDLINPDENAPSVARGYVDLAGVGNGAGIFEKNKYVPEGGITEYTLFRRTYTLDPVSQSNAKTIDKRNNKKFWKHIDLSKDLFDNVPSFTPKASYENKNASFDKHNFVEDKPNTLTCSFGIQATDNTFSGGNGATRCFNWNSVGYYDEFLWYKKTTDSDWTCVESYKDGVDYTSATGLNRSTDPDCIKRGLSEYYTRIRWETYYGAPITTHKVMVTGLTAGVYNYKVGRKNENGEPSDYISKTREFTIRADEDVTSFDFIQTTDQQGASWEEYQIWDLSADFINRNERIGQTPRVADGDPIPSVNSTDFDFTINTGDITYNGSRPNEWIDYYNGYSYLDDKEEMLTLGNNDLAPVPENPTSVVNPELYGMTMLGDGSETPYKVNHIVADLFYTQEMDYDNPPIFIGSSIISGANKTYRVPSLYSFNYGQYHFISLNSEIRTMPDDPNKITTLRGEFCVEDNSAGARKSEIYENIEDWLVRDLLIWKNGSVPNEYTRYSPQNCQKAIVYCHEMPFTITADATYQEYINPESTGIIWREKAKANLNLRHDFEFQRLFKIWNIRLIFGGHKHTCSISYPIYDAPTDYVPYSSTDQNLMEQIANVDTFNPIIQVLRTSNEEEHGLNAKLHKLFTDFSSYRGDIFNSTNNNVTVDGVTINAKSTNVSTNSKPLVRTEIVDSITAPTYVMCQATGFKNLSNSDTSADTNYCQWLRNLVPLGTEPQWYPFYTRFRVTPTRIYVSMERVRGLYTPSSKAGFWDVNRDMPNGHEAKMNTISRYHWADCEIPLD